MPRLVVRPWAWLLDRPDSPRSVIQRSCTLQLAPDQIPICVFQKYVWEAAVVSSEAGGLTGGREATCGTNRALLKRRIYVGYLLFCST